MKFSQYLKEEFDKFKLGNYNGDGKNKWNVKNVDDLIKFTKILSQYNSPNLTRDLEMRKFVFLGKEVKTTMVDPFDIEGHGSQPTFKIKSADQGFDRDVFIKYFKKAVDFLAQKTRTQTYKNLAVKKGKDSFVFIYPSINGLQITGGSENKNPEYFNDKTLGNLKKIFHLFKNTLKDEYFDPDNKAAHFPIYFLDYIILPALINIAEKLAKDEI